MTPPHFKNSQEEEKNLIFISSSNVYHNGSASEKRVYLQTFLSGAPNFQPIIAHLLLSYLYSFDASLIHNPSLSSLDILLSQ